MWTWLLPSQTFCSETTSRSSSLKVRHFTNNCVSDGSLSAGYEHVQQRSGVRAARASDEPVWFACGGRRCRQQRRSVFDFSPRCRFASRHLPAFPVSHWRSHSSLARLSSLRNVTHTCRRLDFTSFAAYVSNFGPQCNYIWYVPANSTNPRRLCWYFAVLIRTKHALKDINMAENVYCCLSFPFIQYQNWPCDLLRFKKS